MQKANQQRNNSPSNNDKLHFQHQPDVALPHDSLLRSDSSSESKINQGSEEGGIAAAFGDGAGEIQQSQKSLLPYSYFALSQTGMIEYNPKKANQDRYLTLPNFENDPAQSLFGVFDGHGACGEVVSQFLVHVLPQELSKELKTAKKGEVSLALQRAFYHTSESLVDRESSNCAFSGSTAVAVYIDGDSLYCANCGDSRAVLGAFTNEGGLVAVPLSDDHKPERADESRRILERNGRIEPCRGSAGEPVGPLRVWLKRQNLPGLAMTRSFGDLVAASVGVIAEPDVIHYKLTESDRFIIIASDGVWEFISNDEAVEMVASCMTPKEACQVLVDESTKRWKKEEDVVDDITAVVIFF